MHELARPRLFDSGQKLLRLLDVVVSNDEGGEGELTAGTSDIFYIGLVPLRILM